MKKTIVTLLCIVNVTCLAMNSKLSKEETQYRQRLRELQFLERKTKAEESQAQLLASIAASQEKIVKLKAEKLELLKSNKMDGIRARL